MESSLINGKEDFLSVDKPVPGQNFVCISFVSPEKTLIEKSNFNYYKFLKEKFNYSFDFEKFQEEYKNYLDFNYKSLDDEFSKQNNFQTSVRGIKIRGSYDTQREADIRAKVLQKIDPSFHVFVGQVGYWLPWDPNADQIEDQQYGEEQLNNLVSKYKENEILKEKFYEKEKSERIKECMKDNIINNSNNSSKIDELENDQKNISDEQIQSGNESVSVEDLLNKLSENSNHEDIKKEFENYNLNEMGKSK